MTNRRGFFFIPIAYVAQRFGVAAPQMIKEEAWISSMSEGEYLAWREFEVAHNHWIDQINRGVFDVRDWKRFREAFKGIGGCK